MLKKVENHCTVLYSLEYYAGISFDYVEGKYQQQVPVTLKLNKAFVDGALDGVGKHGM